MGAGSRPGPLATVQLAGRRLPGCLALAQKRVALAPSDVAAGLQMPRGSTGMARRRARTRVRARRDNACAAWAPCQRHFRSCSLRCHRTCVGPARPGCGRRRRARVERGLRRTHRAPYAISIAPCDRDNASVVNGIYQDRSGIIERKGCSRQKTFARRNGLVRLGAHVESRRAAREFGDRVGVVSRNPV
jgi:hypothetical protein